MGITFRTNVLSLNAQTQLGKHTEELSAVSEQLSSGLRINKASDDAAGLAISESLGLKTRVLQQGVRNINDGISFLNIADGALNELSSIAIRLQELASQASNGSITNNQRKSLDEEAQALSKEYTRIAQSTEFNGYQLFAGDFDSLHIQAGFGTEGGITSGIGGAIFDGTFSVDSTTTPGGARIFANELADIDGDGHLDLITAGYGAGIQVRVSTGDGAGNFTEIGTYSTQVNGSYDVELADVNNDGILDIISAGVDAGTAGESSILLGNGDGTFQAAISYSMNLTYSVDVELADFNGDGNLDIITSGASGGGQSIVYRLGNGDGTFQAATIDTTVDSFGWAVDLGDFNNDGNIDYVVNGTDGAFGNAYVFAGDGEGNFAISGGFSTESNTGQDISLADLNNDGNLDIVTSGFGTLDGEINVRLGNGDFTFGSQITYTKPLTNLANFELVDINSDGALDIIGSGQEGTGVAFFRLGNGDGTFGDHNQFASGQVNSSPGVAIGDVNEDGVLDLVTGGWSAGGVVASYSTILGNTTHGVSSVNPFDLSTQAKALQAVPIFERTQANLSLQRGEIGAFQSRLNSAVNTTNITAENLVSARSRIRDVDVAEKAAQLVSAQIKQEAAVSLLAQANGLPELVLNLLKA